MPLCIVLIALMYFILREPCPCDEEDKVVEGLDWWWWVLIGWLGIGLGVLGFGLIHNRQYLKERLDFNYLYIALTVFIGAFGPVWWDRVVSVNIGKVFDEAQEAVQQQALKDIGELPVESW